MRLLRRHVHNVVEDIRREMPLKEARHFIALGERAVRGGAGGELRPAPSGGGQRPFLALCDELAAFEVDELVERYRIPHADAETLVPALLANRELLLEPRPARSWPPTPRSGPACCSTSPAARTAWASGLRQAGAGQR